VGGIALETKNVIGAALADSDWWLNNRLNCDTLAIGAESISLDRNSA
jgi:hypothetical protein